MGGALGRRVALGLAVFMAGAACTMVFGLSQGRAATTAITVRSPASVSVAGETAATTDTLSVASSFALGTAADSVSLDVRIDRSFTNKVPAHTGGTCSQIQGVKNGPFDPVALPNAQLLVLWSPLAWGGTNFALPTPPPQRFGIDGVSYRDTHSQAIVSCRNLPHNGGVNVVSTITDTRELTGSFSAAGLPSGCYVFDVVDSVFGYGEIDNATLSGGFASFCVSHQNLPLTKCLTGAPLQFSSGDSIDVSVGWASQQESQLQHFLDVQNGSLSITDAGGATVVSTSWATGDRSLWSWPPYPTIVYPNGKGSQGQQALRIDFGSAVTLQPGTYTLHARFALTQGVNDGFGAIPPGPWLKIDSCPFTVT